MSETSTEVYDIIMYGLIDFVVEYFSDEKIFPLENVFYFEKENESFVYFKLKSDYKFDVERYPSIKDYHISKLERKVALLRKEIKQKFDLYCCFDIGLENVGDIIRKHNLYSYDEISDRIF